MSYVAYFLYLALILDVPRGLGIKMGDYDVDGWLTIKLLQDDYVRMGKAVYQANDRSNQILTTAWAPN